MKTCINEDCKSYLRKTGCKQCVVCGCDVVEAWQCRICDHVDTRSGLKEHMMDDHAEEWSEKVRA